MQARRTCPGLLKWMEELQPKEAHFPDHLLPQDLRHDGWSLVRDEAGRGGSWGGDDQTVHLTIPGTTPTSSRLIPDEAPPSLANLGGAEVERSCARHGRWRSHVAMGTASGLLNVGLM